MTVARDATSPGASVLHLYAIDPPFLSSLVLSADALTSSAGGSASHRAVKDPPTSSAGWALQAASIRELKHVLAEGKITALPPSRIRDDGSQSLRHELNSIVLRRIVQEDF